MIDKVYANMKQYLGQRVTKAQRQAGKDSAASLGLTEAQHGLLMADTQALHTKDPKAVEEEIKKRVNP